MQYEEIVDQIQSKRRFGQAFGREVTEEMMERLDHPETGMRILHIAGTNGKGSTAAFVSSILQAAGFVVGRFTSPHLVCFRERICVNQEMIPEEDVVRLGERLLQLPMDLEPTMFDMCLGMAILYFKERECDYVVLETGLGGAKDSTAGLGEVPVVTGFTNIGFDHVNILGDTLEKIAAEKAGVLKKGTVAVLGKMDSSARDVIKAKADSLGVKTVNVDNLLTKISTWEIPLNGLFQRDNAALAVGMVEALFNQQSGYLFDNHQVFKQGIAAAGWPGRMEVLSQNPFVMVDGAHNPQGVEALFNSLTSMYPKEQFIFLMGVMADKDYIGMIRQMLPIAGRFLTVTVESERSLQGEELAEKIRQAGCDAMAYSDVNEALAGGMQLAAQENKRLVIFGSLYFVGEIKHILQ
ncbi:MAG: bifunctional folylpolyglutamate synthase/dihydrofolate synthase [Lachnospiraceae bacterium]|nr:bifunctional folylpolyglutamate synthase/dihydrofolate synthase [Lachnospiraceae bacterium]